MWQHIYGNLPGTPSDSSRWFWTAFQWPIFHTFVGISNNLLENFHIHNSSLEKLLATRIFTSTSITSRPRNTEKERTQKIKIFLLLPQRLLPLRFHQRVCSQLAVPVRVFCSRPKLLLYSSPELLLCSRSELLLLVALLALISEATGKCFCLGSRWKFYKPWKSIRLLRMWCRNIL